MRQVLRHYAIDPKRIALLGESAGAAMAIDLGLVNGDVFSRVISFSGFRPFFGRHEFDLLQRHGKSVVYIGINEPESDALQMPDFAAWLREQGYSATYVEDPGDHNLPRVRVTPGLNWLAKSWQ